MPTPVAEIPHVEETAVHASTEPSQVPESNEPSQAPAPSEPADEGQVTILVHPELQKAKPIDIAAIEGTSEPKRAPYAEKVLEKSIDMLKDGLVGSGERKMYTERSPLIKSEVVAPKADLPKTDPLRAPKVTVDITKAFKKQKTPDQIALEQEAEKLGEAIRNLGESLNRALCEKFVEQMRVRLKKSNLTDADIENAAKMYVDQRRKMQAAQ